MKIRSKQPSDFNRKTLFFLVSLSENNFKAKYNKYHQANARRLYSTLSTEIIEAIANSDIVNLKKWIKLIINIKNIEDPLTLQNFNQDVDKSIANSNFIILACKYNKIEILDYLFNNVEILDLFKTYPKFIKPDDVDDENHTAFYYAIRSGNSQLLKFLIKKWPYNYCPLIAKDVCDLLAYLQEELKLKNINISQEISFLIESLVIGSHFYSDSSNKQVTDINITNQNIEERIDLIINNIELLIQDYSNSNFNDKFFYVAKFITQNIHILKSSLKSTYNNLPWEEIELCLIAFISNYKNSDSQTKVFQNFAVTKNKLLNYLKLFSNLLEKEKIIISTMNIKRLITLPNDNRITIVKSIIKNTPDFKELYEDYQYLRDTYSLEIINQYVNLAIVANPNDNTGQLVIIRTLQIISEYLKNTLESPKMSPIISNILLSSLPTNTRQLIINLQNSLSYCFSDLIKLKIESNMDHSFSNIQQDMKTMNTAIINIIYKNKYQYISIVCKKIMESETMNEVNLILETINEFNVSDWYNNNEINQYNSIMTGIKELTDIMVKNNVKDESMPYLVSLMEKEFTRDNDALDYCSLLLRLAKMQNFVKKKYFTETTLQELKNYAKKLASDLSMSIKEDDNICEKIREELMNFFSANSKNLCPTDILRANDIMLNLLHKLGSNLKWREEISNKLDQTNISDEYFFEEINSNNRNHNNVSKLNEKYVAKTSALYKILNSNNIDDFFGYKKNKKLQVAVELLVFDILSILNDPEINVLIDDKLYLEKYTPVLKSKNLRNYLAHGNDILKLLHTDPAVAIFLNAKKFIQRNMIENNPKINKVIQNNINGLKKKYEQELKIIVNQEEMFHALENGDLKKLTETLKKGADIRGKNIQSWTALHFAAKGPNIDAVKFVLDQNVNFTITNDSGENALHIAAQYGRKSTVELFIKNGCDINETDNFRKTPLHKAAENGHEHIVRILMRNKADTFSLDDFGLAPLHIAVSANYIKVIEILCQRECHIDDNETTFGFTALHTAARFGHVELIKYLIERKANVNSQTYVKSTPIFEAASNGYTEIVKILISHGAKINVFNAHGLTVLDYAIKINHEEIVELLLVHGADPNFRYSVGSYASITHAAERGYLNILKLLLKYNANVNVLTYDSCAPLHYAAVSGHVDIIDTLIKNQANIEIKNNTDVTPLFLAAVEGHDNVLEFLLKKGASHKVTDSKKFTPLHVAALYGHIKCVEVLLKYNADVQAEDKDGKRALHYSSINGHTDIIKLLISKGADINAKDSQEYTALHFASEEGQLEAVKILIENGANVDLQTKMGFTPLHCSTINGYINVVKYLVRNTAEICSEIAIEILHIALIYNYENIAKFLINYGLPINFKSLDGFIPLEIAVCQNQPVIVKLLLKQGASLNKIKGGSLCHAVKNGHKDIVKILYDHEKIDINYKFLGKYTLLHIAIMFNHVNVVNFLLDNGADMHDSSDETPLMIATKFGFIDIVKLLLHKNVDTSIGTDKFNSPLKKAILCGHPEIFKLLFEYDQVDVNQNYTNKMVLLNSAAFVGNLPITEFLVKKGANIRITDPFGCKPIHHASFGGHINIVEYYINKGISLYDPDLGGNTILHFAVELQRNELVNYLLEKRFNVNTVNLLGTSPLHRAARGKSRKIVENLLNHGAIYNCMDKKNQKPCDLVENQSINNLFNCIDKLFIAVHKNDIDKVKQCIDQKVVINTINVYRMTALHYATKHGYKEIVKLLLNNNANPNITNVNGWTPLHFAVQFCDLETVKILLMNGAVYDVVNYQNKIPLDLAKNRDIIELLKQVNQSFIYAKIRSTQVINYLNNIGQSDISKVKAIMNAKNISNETLTTCAYHKNFPDFDSLVNILQENSLNLINTAENLKNLQKYDEALKIYEDIIEKRKKIFNADDLGILMMKSNIAMIHLSQMNYEKSLDIYTEIYNKKKKIIGPNDSNTLETNFMIALLLFKLKRVKESYAWIDETYDKQKAILNCKNTKLLMTQVHMAQVLSSLKKYDESLLCYKNALDKFIKLCGENNRNIFSLKISIATIYCSQGDYDEALKLYEEVYKAKKCTFDSNDIIFLKMISVKINVLTVQKKYKEALKAYSQLLISQTEAAGPNDLDTLYTKFKIANIFLNQGNHLEALKIYLIICKPLVKLLSHNHKDFKSLIKRIKFIKKVYNLKEENYLQEECFGQIKISEAVKSEKSIEKLLKIGVNINSQDHRGLTLLHYAVHNQDEDIIKFLLKNNADCCLFSNKGNTVLHFAVIKNNKSIVLSLLKHTKQVLKSSEFNSFINAKTIAGGMTCMHIAAQKGFQDIVEILLNNGAIYNDINYAEHKTPYDLCNNDNIKQLLKFIDELFMDAEIGNNQIIDKLKNFDITKNVIILNTRNIIGETLINIVILNKHKNLALQLLQILKSA